jgi:hypothetical protein
MSRKASSKVNNNKVVLTCNNPYPISTKQINGTCVTLASERGLLSIFEAFICAIRRTGVFIDPMFSIDLGTKNLAIIKTEFTDEYLLLLILSKSEAYKTSRLDPLTQQPKPTDDIPQLVQFSNIISEIIGETTPSPAIITFCSLALLLFATFIFCRPDRDCNSVKYKEYFNKNFFSSKEI